MKWFENEQPKIGDVRIVEDFLLIPLKIGKETRWLENVKIIQQYQEVSEPSVLGLTMLSENKWVNLDFKN